ALHPPVLRPDRKPGPIAILQPESEPRRSPDTRPPAAPQNIRHRESLKDFVDFRLLLYRRITRRRTRLRVDFLHGSPRSRGCPQRVRRSHPPVRAFFGLDPDVWRGVRPSTPHLLYAKPVPAYRRKFLQVSRFPHFTPLPVGLRQQPDASPTY